MILCPFGCGERLYPDGKHSNAEQAAIDKHRPECFNIRVPVLPLDGRDAAQAKRAAPVLETVKEPIASPRAARWSLFAAHALQGLLAAPAEMRGDGNQAQIAATYADDLLAEHDARFK